MKNIDVVKSFIEYAQSDNKDATNQLCHEDFHVLESEGLPYGGCWKGAEGFWQLIDFVYGAWDMPEIETLQIIGSDDAETFAIEMSMSGIGAKTGTKFDTTVCELWTVKDKKVYSIKPYYWDTKLLSKVYGEN